MGMLQSPPDCRCLGPIMPPHMHPRPYPAAPLPDEAKIFSLDSFPHVTSLLFGSPR